MKNQTSSVVIAAALGLSPDGVPAKKEGDCAYCGLRIHEGDPHVPFQAGPAFMDDHSLAAKGSDMVCGCCAQLLSAESLRATGYGVFHSGGVMPFRKWADITAALRNPPESPFVAVYATANNQHMAWRAPVNYSRDLFYVRVGLRDLKIRRPVLLRAVDACVRLGEYMGVKPTEKSLAHPFAVLSNNLKDPAHEVMRRNGDKATLEESAAALPDDFALVSGLTLGETWGLRFLLSPNAGKEKPV